MNFGSPYDKVWVGNNQILLFCPFLFTVDFKALWGGLAPILGPIYGKVPEREPIFLNDSSKSSMDTQKLIPVEILTYFFRFGD